MPRSRGKLCSPTRRPKIDGKKVSIERGDTFYGEIQHFEVQIELVQEKWSFLAPESKMRMTSLRLNDAPTFFCKRTRKLKFGRFPINRIFHQS